MKKPILSFLAGFTVVFLMALTTDQIIQKVYDSANTALRVNVVTGGSGGTVTGSGASTQLAYWTGASALGGNANITLTDPSGNPTLNVRSGGFPTINLETTSSAQYANLIVATDVQAFQIYAIGTTYPSGSALDDKADSVVYETTNAGSTYFIARDSAIKFVVGGVAAANEAWDITSSGNLTSVGAGRNLTASGILTMGSGSGTTITDSTGLILSAALNTVAVANGGTNLTAAADDNVMVGNGTTWQTKAMPNCTDTGGNHLNYTASTNTFSCGTS